MLDAATAYPMLRRRHRRHRRRRIDARLIRRGGWSVAVIALVAAAAWWWSRPPSADARVLLDQSLAAMRRGDWHGAADAARAAAAARPDAGIVHVALARAELALDHGAPAQAALERAAATGFPTTRLHALLAEALLLQGDADGALDQVAATSPRDAAHAARIRARALAASGQPVDARRTLEALVAAARQDGAAWSDLGRLRLTQGDLGGATLAATRALRLRPGDPATLTLMGELVRARYGLLAALPWFEAALRRDARYHPALIEYAATLGEAGRNADMLAALRRAMAAEPSRPEPFYLQAVLAARTGRFDLAQGLLTRGGGVPGASLLAGAIDYAAGRYQQAAVKWRDLSTAQPMNLAVRRLLASALLRAGDAKGALAVLRPVVLRADADSDSLLIAARGLEAIGDRAAAGRLLDRAATGGGASTAFASDQGVTVLALGAAQAPTDPTYAVGLIRGLLGSGDAGGAVARARMLADAAPGAPAAWLALGDTLAVTGRDARRAYGRAADLAFDEPTMLRLVDAQARAGRADEAAATLALYLGQNPQSAAGRRMLGHLQVETGEWDAAIDTLEGVRRRVGHADAALLIDLSLAYAGADDAEVAVRYARASYHLQPMNADAADAYGVALAAAGRAGDARQLLDKAVALAPASRAIAAHRRQLG